MPNLTKLDLSNNKIKYLRALSKADSIKELNLMVNEFESVAALSTMTNLEVLEMGEYWFSYDDEEENLEELISRYAVQTEYIYRQKEIFIDGAFDNLTNLRKLVLVNVGIVSIEFLNEFEELEELNLDYSKVYSRQESLENLNGLKYLSLNSTLFDARTSQPSGSGINDISIIADMTSLEHLNICGNPLKDLSRLGELTNLTYLDISGSKITDIIFLSRLQNLTHLLLGNCQYVVDFSPLKDLNDIEYLDLGYANLKYFDYISHMHGLKYLNLMDALYNSIDGIENMKDLEYLNIHQGSCSVEERIEIASCTPFNSIDEWEDFINMYHIDSDLILNLKNLVHYIASEINAGIPLDFKNLEYLKPASAADGIPVNVKEVEVSSNSSEIQKDMEYISYFNNLERLELRAHVEEDCVIKIPYLENLRILNIDISSDYNITIDLSSLKGQSKLKYIRIACGRGDYDYREKNFKIESLEGLENCEDLRVIIINDSNLSDISALETCSKLEIVEFSNCNISDISALTDKYYLEELNLMKNNITDITALKNCYRLNRLRLSENPLTNADVIMEMPMIADVWLDSTLCKRSSELSSYMKKMFTRWNH